MTDIEELKQTIRRLHGVDAMHLDTVPVKEIFQGQVIWDGKVEVFSLSAHPKAKVAYAWMHEMDDPTKPKRHVTVLSVPPITSAQDAVRAVILKDFRDREKKR